MYLKNETSVVIVGAGPSGLAIAACLTRVSIPYIILEREDCHSSLWRKRTYDRLHLHLAKEFCGLPFKQHDPSAPTYVPKAGFIKYLDDYVVEFDIKPRYNRSVRSVSYNEDEKKWRSEATNLESDMVEVYSSEFLVIASGDNDASYIPNIPGIENFKGEIKHSNAYKSGLKYVGEDVLVVGCGNSGMEIAYDLSNFGANTSIVIRNPFHVCTRSIIRVGMRLLKYMPVSTVDPIVQTAARLWYGDLSKYGIQTPKVGPFYGKVVFGRSPVIDVGTVAKIRSGNIKVVPGIIEIKEDGVLFDNGEEHKFKAIVFATGYRVMARQWFNDYEMVLTNDGIPKNKFPEHWKGEKRSYCAGFSKMGLFGIAKDAQEIVADIAAKFKVEE